MVTGGREDRAQSPDLLRDASVKGAILHRGVWVLQLRLDGIVSQRHQAKVERKTFCGQQPASRKQAEVEPVQTATFGLSKAGSSRRALRG